MSTPNPQELAVRRESLQIPVELLAEALNTEPILVRLAEESIHTPFTTYVLSQVANLRHYYDAAMTQVEQLVREFVEGNLQTIVEAIQQDEYSSDLPVSLYAKSVNLPVYDSDELMWEAEPAWRGLPAATFNIMSTQTKSMYEFLYKNEDWFVPLHLVEATSMHLASLVDQSFSSEDVTSEDWSDDDDQDG